MLFVLAALLCAYALAAPLAPMMSVTVSKNTDVLISLPGYDPSGSKLSQIFSDYGYEPKRGAALASPTGGTVTGSRNRFVYSPPPNTNEPVDKWAWFTYTVTDKSGVTSAPGIVWLVPPHKTIVFSDFATSLDGWSVVGNGGKAAALAAGGLTYEPFSRGVLNHYVLATDAEINTNKNTKLDDMLWYFVAPAKFMGMHNIAYGGVLAFSIASAAGDFTAGNINTGAQVVILECASCASGAGIRLAKFADDTIMPLDGKPRQVSIPLIESEWRKDPRNTLLAWNAPTQCEMVEVLGDISSLRILGDHTRWYESVAIDRVGYRTGPSVPLACADTYY